MILILSSDGDASTDFVIQKLLQLGYPYLRLNSYDLLTPGFELSLTSEGVTMLINGSPVQINQIGAVWYRKFGFFRNSKFYENASQIMFHENLDNLSKEFSTILGTVVGLLDGKTWLTDPKFIDLNKFQVLGYAAECGLDIPESHVICSKISLEKLRVGGSIITKSIRDPWRLKVDDDVYTMYTSEIDDKSLEDLPETFFPSLIQKKIEKEYELRIFCIMNKTYSMAIFSQLDKQTELDFRRYNYQKPNRAVPYQLPSEVETKILKLKDKLNLNCCSIDLIKGKNGKFYFLEVNPTGQFGMVDFPCNYSLHEAVAETLMDLDTKTLKKNERISTGDGGY